VVHEAVRGMRRRLTKNLTKSRRIVLVVRSNQKKGRHNLGLASLPDTKLSRRPALETNPFFASKILIGTGAAADCICCAQASGQPTSKSIVAKSRKEA
jgi:hypothetical protein